MRAWRGSQEQPGLWVAAAAPDASVRLSPLQAKRVCAVPLALALQEALQGSQRAATGQATGACWTRLQSGLLTMSQARNLIPMDAAEPQVSILRGHGVCLTDLQLQAGQRAGWCASSAAFYLRKLRGYFA